MKYSIELDKTEYYPGEYLSGRVKVKPNKKTQIKDIEMTLSLIEDWQYLPYNETKNNTQDICKFLLNAYLYLDKPKDSILELDTQEYIFPFDEKLPDYLLPSFEYPQNTYCGFLRYKISAKFVAPQKLLSYSLGYIIIKAIPKKDSTLNVKSSQKIKKWGVFSRGQTQLNVNCVTKNYKLTDQIPFEIEIDNTQSKMKVNVCKIKFCRKIIFKDKESFLEKYSNEESLIKVEFKDFVNKKEKKKFNHTINLNTIQYKNFKPISTPIKIQDNFKDFLPSLDGIILSCEYYIIVILKFDHFVPKEERPKAVIPIYIVHKLDNDHIEKALKQSEVLKNNELNKNNNDIFINEFEILDKNGKNQNQDQNNNMNSGNEINNNYNNVNNNMKQEGGMIYNGFNRGIEYNNFNNQNGQLLYNENYLKEENNLPPKEDDDVDLPSRDTIMREYEKREHNSNSINNNFNNMHNNNLNNNNNYNNAYNNNNINNNNINNNNINDNNNNINDNMNINDIKFLNDFGGNNDLINQNVNNNNINDKNIIENKPNISFNNNNKFAYPSLDDINFNDEIKNDNPIKQDKNNSNYNQNNQINNNYNYNQNENYNNPGNNNFNYNYNKNENYNNQINNNFNYNQNINYNNQGNQGNNIYNYNPNDNYNNDIQNRESNFNLLKYDYNNNEEEEKDKNGGQNNVIDINAI